MRNYRWVCHACEAVNSPDSRVCSNCSFPAEATGEDIEAAISKNPKAKLQSNLTPNQKALRNLAIAMILVGAFMIKFSHSEPYVAIGILLAGLGVLIKERLRAINDKYKA